MIWIKMKPKYTDSVNKMIYNMLNFISRQHKTDKLIKWWLHFEIFQWKMEFKKYFPPHPTIHLSFLTYFMYLLMEIVSTMTTRASTSNYIRGAWWQISYNVLANIGCTRFLVSINSSELKALKTLGIWLPYTFARLV